MPDTALRVAVSASPADELATTVSVRAVPAGAIGGVTVADVTVTASVERVTGPQGAHAPLESHTVPLSTIAALTGSASAASKSADARNFFIIGVFPS